MSQWEPMREDIYDILENGDIMLVSSTSVAKKEGLLVWRWNNTITYGYGAKYTGLWILLCISSSDGLPYIVLILKIEVASMISFMVVMTDFSAFRVSFTAI
jgi:hypothetical protein